MLAHTGRLSIVVTLATWIGFGSQTVDAAFPTIRLEPVVQRQVVSPVDIANAGDGSNRLFVANQRGRIDVIQSGSLLATPLLDLSANLIPERQGYDERGLLGITFHPDFGVPSSPGEGKFYVYYSAPSLSAGTANNPIDHQSVLAEYRVDSTNPNVADPLSERILMRIDEPQFNHNGGFVAFGPDGYLYLATGDGGSANDNNAGHTGGNSSQPSGVLGNAQDLSSLLGKIHRIDVDGTNGPGGQYGIPADNPFVDVAGARGEIYAYGFRNPWRSSFDTDANGTTRLIVADVGQGAIEEVNLVDKGGNYGWRIREGSFEFDNTVSPTPPATLIGPIAEYAHPGANVGLEEIGLSITGGYVYRGSEFPELEGKYIFADWSTDFRSPNGTLLGLDEDAAGNFQLTKLEVEGGNPIGEYILAFGRDEQGELYVATKTALAASGLDPSTNTPTGSIYRIAVVPEPTSAWLLITAIAGLLHLHRREWRA
ncbi:MAG: PQQ-dependent sugar dehydrogenase [Planctomycetales bacterium]|nr:PQQ-dependent sugar dehydrogenase [Planctomycetales bacterium]